MMLLPVACVRARAPVQEVALSLWGLQPGDVRPVLEDLQDWYNSELMLNLQKAAVSSAEL